ncbi:MAG: cytochrome c biogenesis protein CcsA [Anaerolineae bacterium]|nr:cytochrome c biogenesis protein CcsA [Anaerolineae bacterium]MDW8098834.1 cytochrome c biogenesis protein CcsA [Anaerolineae bacterium]
MAKGRDLWMLGLDVIAAIAVLVVLYMALVWAPDAANLTTPVERAAQRIFYLHMGANVGAGLGFLVTFVASIIYLFSRRRIWDMLALSSAELGVVFATAVLATGSIWARPTWNTWWTWDPRLTTAAIVWLLYVAYLMLRGALTDPARRARFAAVYGIFAFFSVPLTFMSIRWWRTIHPVVLGGSNPEAQGGFTLGPSIRLTMFVAMIAFAILYTALLVHRVRLERAAEEIEQLKEQFA